MSAHDEDQTVGLYEGLLTTRAIRRYLDEDIPEDDLNRLFFAATRAPSGHNTQPFRFIVLRRTPEAAEARELLGQGFVESWSRNRQEPDPDDSSRRARMARTMNHFVDNIADAPVIALACYRTGSLTPGITEGASVFPACQNLLLAARSMGYGGVLTNWHRPVADELRKLFDLPDDVEIVATLPIGRPAGGHGSVRRLPLPELIYENRFGESASWAEDPPGTRYTGGG